MQNAAMVCHAAHEFLVARSFVYNVVKIPRRNFLVRFSHRPAVFACKRTYEIRNSEQEQFAKLFRHIRRFGVIFRHVVGNFNKFVLVYLMREQSVIRMEDFGKERSVFKLR